MFKRPVDSDQNEATWTLTRRGLLAGAMGSAATAALGLDVGAPGDEEATFASPSAVEELDRFGDPTPLADLVAGWRSLSLPLAPAWQVVEGEWEYAKGAKSEGLQAKIDQFPSSRQTTKLKHRVLEPDTPLWYRSNIKMSTPCAVRIAADDGAHLFVNGKRIPATGQIFRVPKQSETDLDVVVRVLNKAVYGGLISVRWCPTDEYDAYESALSLRQRLDRAITKVRRLRSVSKPLLDSATLAVRQYSESTVGALERRLARLPLVTIGPVVHQHSTETAVIAWETDVKSEAGLVYRVEGGQARSAKIASDGTFHRATLVGLKPNAVVSYQPKVKGTQVPSQKFRSLPARAGFQFTVWGDSHIGFSRFRQNVGAMLFEESAFTVGVGDLVVDAASKRPWEEFFDLGGPLFATTPVFFTGGNHDYDDCFEDLNSEFYNRYARLDAKPFYAWTVANCRFIALDPNIQFPTGIDEGSEQHRWLLAELESAECRSAEWRFVFIHQPPYGRGWTDYAGDLPIRSLLDSLIPKHRIDFVVSGHIHDYERLTRDYDGHSCTFLVVGGAGGGLEDGPENPEPKMDVVAVRHHYGRFTVEAGLVRFEAFHTDTTLLDRCERRR